MDIVSSKITTVHFFESWDDDLHRNAHILLVQFIETPQQTVLLLFLLERCVNHNNIIYGFIELFS